MPPSHPRANRTQVTATPLIVSQLSEECGRSSLGSLIEVPLHSPRHCSSWSPQAVTAMLLYDMGSFAYPTYFPREEVFRGFVLEPTPTFTGRHLGITYCQHDFVKVNLHPSCKDTRFISCFKSYRTCKNAYSPHRGMHIHASWNAGAGTHDVTPKEHPFPLKPPFHSLMEWRHPHLVAAAGLLSFFLLFTPASDAADALKTCACLLKECRLELAKCIGNPACAANIACIQTCNDRPDETECQIKCGDLFENEVVDQFNECAVSRKKCVPQKSDVGEFPIPDSSVLVQSFSMADFSGKWYISSGLNPTFDTFDCQLHEFHPESEKLVGNLTWRIQTPDGGFFTRSTAQRFVQDPSQPGILYNHNNEFLHYEDDWYILSSKVENKPDDYIFVYYRGRNDAWDGYGGAVVYTRSKVLPQSIVPELEKAASRAGLDFKRFKTTDNTCGPEPPLVERLEKKVEEGEKTVLREVEELEEEVEKVGRTEMSLFQRLAQGFQEFKQDEEFFLKELSQEEMEILRGLKMEATELGKLFSEALPLRKLR